MSSLSRKHLVTVVFPTVGWYSFSYTLRKIKQRKIKKELLIKIHTRTAKSVAKQQSILMPQGGEKRGRTGKKAVY